MEQHASFVLLKKNFWLWWVCVILLTFGNRTALKILLYLPSAHSWSFYSIRLWIKITFIQCDVALFMIAYTLFSTITPYIATGAESNANNTRDCKTCFYWFDIWMLRPWFEFINHVVSSVMAKYGSPVAMYHNPSLLCKYIMTAAEPRQCFRLYGIFGWLVRPPVCLSVRNLIGCNDIHVIFRMGREWNEKPGIFGDIKSDTLDRFLTNFNNSSNTAQGTIGNIRD